MRNKMDVLKKIEEVLNEAVLSPKKVIELLKKDKVGYGVRESFNDEKDKMEYHVSKIDDLGEYERNKYWDIEDTYDNKTAAIEKAKQLAKADKSGIYIGFEKE